MAAIPLLPKEGIGLIHKNMHEARIRGMPRNMELPQTYYWFYQQVRNHGPWDYKPRIQIISATLGHDCGECGEKG